MRRVQRDEQVPLARRRAAEPLQRRRDDVPRRGVEQHTVDEIGAPPADDRRAPRPEAVAETESFAGHRVQLLAGRLVAERGDQLVQVVEGAKTAEQFGRDSHAVCPGW